MFKQDRLSCSGLLQPLYFRPCYSGVAKPDRNEKKKNQTLMIQILNKDLSDKETYMSSSIPMNIDFIPHLFDFIF